MSKLEKINRDMLAAIKAGDSIKKNLLRTLKGEAEGEAKKGFPLDDQLIERVAKKFVKSIEIGLPSFDSLNREIAERELSVLREYLAESLPDEDLIAMIKQAIESNSDKANQYASGNKAVIGFFVGMVMKTSKGKADAKRTQQLIENEFFNIYT